MPRHEPSPTHLSSLCLRSLGKKHASSCMWPGSCLHGDLQSIPPVLQDLPSSTASHPTEFSTSSHPAESCSSLKPCSSFYHPKSIYLFLKYLKVERKRKEKEKMCTAPALFRGLAHTGMRCSCISQHFHIVSCICSDLKSHHTQSCILLYLKLYPKHFPHFTKILHITI